MSDDALEAFEQIEAALSPALLTDRLAAVLRSIALAAADGTLTACAPISDLTRRARCQCAKTWRRRRDRLRQLGLIEVKKQSRQGVRGSRPDLHTITAPRWAVAGTRIRKSMRGPASGPAERRAS